MHFQTYFDITNDTTPTSTSCTGDSIVITFADDMQSQTIMLTFTKDKTQVTLTKVALTFEILNTTLVNATGNFNRTVIV